MTRTTDSLTRHLNYLHKNDKIKTIFLGDSNVERFFTTGKNLIQHNHKVGICGVGGNCLEHITWRFHQMIPTLQKMKHFEKIIIFGGSNDLMKAKTTPHQIYLEMVALIDLIKKNFPNVHVQVIIIPFIWEHSRCKLTGQELFENGKELASKYASIQQADSWIDCSSPFMTKDYYDDHVHLNRKGYEKLFELIFSTS